MRKDHFADDDRRDANRSKIGGEALLARLILYHPEHAPDHLRPKPPPKPEPEPVLLLDPVPIPDIIITDELLRSVTVRAIQKFVCREYGISREILCSTRRYGEVTTARHIAIYLASELTRLSRPNLGRLFCRDHSSIYSAVQSMTKRRARDQGLHNRILALRSRLLAELSPEPVS